MLKEINKITKLKRSMQKKKTQKILKIQIKLWTLECTQKNS